MGVLTAELKIPLPLLKGIVRVLIIMIQPSDEIIIIHRYGAFIGYY